LEDRHCGNNLPVMNRAASVKPFSLGAQHPVRGERRRFPLVSVLKLLTNVTCDGKSRPSRKNLSTNSLRYFNSLARTGD
jgi:hypothetical protein